MTGHALALTERTHDNARDHVVKMIADEHLDWQLDPGCINDPSKVPDIVEAVVAYLLRGNISNGADVYFMRTTGLTTEERRAMYLMITGIKVSLGEQLEYLPGVQERIKRLEALLDGGRL